jgi:Bifunctional DNA primase/polymerase, N-terminal
MAGIFATAQPKYAALGIATFPFDATEEVKRGPLVTNYQRMGLPASRQMALRFSDAPGIAAMAGPRNKFTVIDVDERGAAGERLLADVQRQFGAPKLVVRTGSGSFHGYYRHNGEDRKIRPDPLRPIDLIGAGSIVLPPSRGFRGNYEIIHGRVEDLAALEPIRSSAALAASDIDLRAARKGGRDTKFWPHIARTAHTVKSLDELIALARELNELMAEPWPDNEVNSEIVKRCKYWWDKTQKGENYFNVGRYVRSTHKELEEMLSNPKDHDACLLLLLLRKCHWGRDFALSNETHKSLGWTLRRLVAGRNRLIETGRIVVLKMATRHTPMICRLGG